MGKQHQAGPARPRKRRALRGNAARRNSQAHQRERATTRRRKAAQTTSWRTTGDRSRVLALDISSVAVGWAFFVNGELRQHGKYLQEGEGHGPKMHAFMHWLMDMFVRLEPTQVVLEAPFHGRNSNAFAVLQLYRAVAMLAHMEVFSRELPAVNQIPAHLIKRVLGLSRPQVPKKDQHSANKRAVCELINQLYETRFQFIESDSAKNTSSDDVADAVAVGHVWHALWVEELPPEAPKRRRRRRS